MAGEFIGSDYLQAASQFGSNLGSTIMGAAGSAGSAIQTGVNQTGGYLSQIAQQAYAPRPDLAYTPTLSARPTTSMPSAYSSPTGGFGSGLNFDMFSPSQPQGPINQPSPTSGFGNWLSGLVKPAAGPTPVAPSPTPMPIETTTTKPVPAPISSPPPSMTAPIGAATGGGLTINIPGAIPKPETGYLSSISGSFANVGDARTQKLVESGKAIDTWSTPGQAKEVKIADARDALEFERQEALYSPTFTPDPLKGIGTRGEASRFYGNELDKMLQNTVRLSSDYHFQAKKTGVRQEANPYENAGDVSLSILKGGNVGDELNKNYVFSPGVQGTLSVLPGGKGTQETAWESAIAGTGNKILNFMPALASLRAAEGSMGPYSALGSYTSEGQKVPVPAENIALMPQAYQTALGQIQKGERGPSSTYTFSMPALESIAKVPGAKSETPVYSLETSPVGKFEMKAETGGGLFAATAGEITPIGDNGRTLSLGGTPTAGASSAAEQLYVKDANFDLKSQMLGTFNTQQADLTASENAILAAGAKGGFNEKGVFSYEYDPTNSVQKSLHEDIIGKQAVVDNTKSTMDKIQLTPYSESAATNKKEDTSFLGTLGSAYEGTNKWLGENVTKKYLPSYENTGVGLLKIGDVAVEGISGAQKSLGMKPIYEKENAYDLLPSQRFLAYNRPEGFTKTSYIYDPLTDTTKKTVVVTGGADESNPVNAGVRFTQSAVQGAFDMPREKPVEALTWLAMPGAFKAAEGVVGYTGTRFAPSIVANPLVTDALTVGKTALMGTFVGGEAAKVPGYTFDVLAPVTGGNEGKIFVFFIEGNDKAGNPLYAAQTPTAMGTRAGEFGMGVTLMSLGSGLASPYKFGYKEKLVVPESTPLTRSMQGLSGYLESKQSGVMGKVFKLPDVGKALLETPKDITTGKPKSISFRERLSSARDIMKSTGDNEALQRELSVASEVYANKAFEPQGPMKAEVTKLVPEVVSEAPTKVEPVSSQVSANVPTKSWSETNLPTFSKAWKSFGIGGEKVETPKIEAPKSIAQPIKAEVPVQKAGDVSNELKFLENVPQRAPEFMSDISSLESKAYTDVLNSRQVGEIFAEKGSTATASTFTGKGGTIRTGKDIDLLQNKPAEFNQAMAEKMTARMESEGFKNPKVEVIYPEGSRFGVEKLGPRNYSNRYYRISAEAGPNGEIIKPFNMESGIDLKMYGMDKPLMLGESRYNYRNLFTPGEERSSGLINSLFFTPGEQRSGLLSSIKNKDTLGVIESLTPGKISLPKSIGETLLGPSTYRPSYKEDVASVSKEKLSNPYINKEVEMSDVNAPPMMKMYSTYVDKADQVRNVLATSRAGGRFFNEENAKVGKSIWDMKNIAKEMRTNYEENLASGKMTKIDQVRAEKVLTKVENLNAKLESGTIEMRTSSTGPIEKVKVKDLVNNYNTKVEKGLDYYRKPQAIEITSENLNPYTRAFLSGGAEVVTPTGLAGVRTEAQTKVRNTAFDTIKRGMESAEVSPKKGDSKSASSGTKLDLLLLPSTGKSGGSKSAGVASASGISSLSQGIERSLSPSPSKGTSGGSGSRGSGSSSSVSYSQSYSGPSSSISDSLSQSSSSSMGSRSGGGPMGGFGLPFLAPPGGGGGGGGRGGHAAGVVKNPLAELKVASNVAFKRMFDFSAPNKLAKDVSGGIRQNQPYGTIGAAGSFSRGASSSIQEATNIGIPKTFKEQTIMKKRPIQGEIERPMMQRKSRKSKPKAKSGKKKGTYK